MKMITKFLILIMLLSFIGCTSMSSRSIGGWEESPAEQEMYSDEPAPPSVSEYSLDSDISNISLENSDITDISSEPENTKSTTTAEQRKRIYTGYLNLMVSEVKQAKQVITEIAEESGGYVEQIIEFSIIIRVPAELFFDIFQMLQDYEEVITKSIETYDVTESYRDLAGRLEIAQKTRDRLYSLLERTENVREKLKILQEIRRLTEEIELINSTLEVLANQISYSRITIDLSPRFQEEQYSRQEIPFSWISALNPLYSSMDTSIENISLELDDNFAVFDKEKYFIAESSDGTIVRVSKTENIPEGDTAFWQKALSYHLGPFYNNSELIVLGDFKSVLFESKDNVPYFYLVSVYIKEDTIYVVEVFFPGEESLNNNIESLKGSIRSFEVQ